MRVFQYGVYAITHEKRIANPNRIKIVRALFEPIVNQVRNIYHIDPKQGTSIDSAFRH